MSNSSKPKSFCVLADFLLKNHGIPIVDTTTLLTIIHAHNDLIAFLDIAENLIHILPLLQTIEPELWNDHKVSPLVNVAQKTVASSEQISKKIKYCNKYSKKHPLHGIIGSHPCYCVFWYDISDSQNSLKYQYLQALYLHAQYCFDRLSENEHKNYGSIIAQVGVRIRKTATVDTEKGVLDKLQKIPTSIEKFYNEVSALLDLESSNEYATHFILLERFIRFVLKQQGGYIKTSQKHEQQPAVINYSLDDYQNNFIEESSFTSVQNSSTSKKDADAAHHHGCAPEESCSGAHMLAENKFLDLDNGQSLLSAIIKTRAKGRYIASANQLLPYRWPRINNNDVNGLLYGVEDLLEARINIKLSKESRYELAAFVSVTFWTSSPLLRTYNTRLIDRLDHLPKILPEDTIYLCPNDSAWAVAEPTINRRKLSKKEWQKYFEPTCQFIVMPMGRLFKDHVVEWNRIQGKNIHTQSIKFFKEDPLILEKNFSTFIKLIAEKNNVRLTTSRIASYLLNWCTDFSNDSAESAYIFGRIPPGSQRTPLYYYAPKINRLQAKYKNIYRAAEASTMQTSPSIPLQNKFTQGRIGSNICPRKQTVKLLVEDLATMVEYRRNDKSNIDYTINFHNAYTTYCLIMLGFNTGYRVVRDPLTSISHIDSKTGFLVISDKDSDDNYNSRIIPLTPICQAQITKYKQHRATMAEHLALLNPQLARELRSTPPDQNQLIWSNKQRNKISQPFFFYLKGNYRLETAKHSTIDKHVKWSMSSLPLNINRHFLRTFLCENDVPGEIVDIFMGHWGLGREPFGKYSSLSPEMFYAQIEKQLEKLTKESGWQVLAGLG